MKISTTKDAQVKKEKFTGDVCPHQISFVLDNPIRRWWRSPNKLVGEYINEGDTVIDLGCGPGFFTIDMAKMVGNSGKVYAVDIQDQMLHKVEQKARIRGLEDIVQIHKAAEDEIGLDIKGNFILAYYMIHEVPDALKTLAQIKNLLKDAGKVLIVEPKFHVSQGRFDEIVTLANSIGLKSLEVSSYKGGRAALFTIE